MTTALATFTDYNESHSRPSDSAWSPAENAAARRAARLARMQLVKATREANLPELPPLAAWDNLTAEQKRDEEPDAGREIKGKRETALVKQATVDNRPTNPTPTPRRDAYQRALADAIKAISMAATLNVNEEHALMMILSDIKNLAA